MTQAPNPGPQPDPDTGLPSLSPRPRRRSLKAVLILGGVATAGVVAGVSFAQYFVYNRLAPLVEDILSTQLNRPVELGDVEGFTLSGLNIGGAVLPPTEASQDYVRVETIRVGFDIPKVVTSLVRDRTLPLNLRLIEPEIYGYEDADGQWLRLNLKESEEESEFGVNINQVQVEDATIILAAYPSPLESPWDNDDFFDELQALEAAIANTEGEVAAAVAEQPPGEEVLQITPETLPESIDESVRPSETLPTVIENIDATAYLRNDNRFVEFEVSATPRQGGTVMIQGEADFKLSRFQAVVRSRELELAQFSPLLPLPGQVLAGTAHANLEVTYHANQLPTLNGTARISNMTVELDATPLAIADINSRLRFDDQTITIEQTRLSYGDARLTADGSVNLETGYDLSAQLQPVTLAEVQNIVNLDLPFEVDGALTSDVRVEGALERPIITGTLRNAATLQLDQIAVDTLLAEFRLIPPILNINQLTIIPVDGGQITGTGNVNLEADGGVLFNAQVSNLPGDALAANYGVALPENYAIGVLDADVEVFGPYSGVQAIANWQLQNSTYPGRGEIRYDGSQVRLQQTRFDLAEETGGGGSATLDAILDLDQGMWEAALEAVNIDLRPFTDQLGGQLNSSLQLSGNLSNLSPEAIALQGQARLANPVLMGVPNSGQLIQPGDWNTTFAWTGDGLQIDQFTAPGIEASGFVAAQLEGDPGIGPVDLAVVLQQFQLAALAAFIPESVRSQLQLQGTADFRGQVTGELANPQVAGNLRLNEFALNTFDFNRVLQGDVRFSLADGGILDLQGGGDRIAVQLDDQLLPENFSIRRQDEEDDLPAFTAEGRTVGDRLRAEIRNFRLNELAFNPLPEQSLGRLGGVVNANIDANLSDLSNPAVAGSVAIARLGVGYLIADRFTGEFSYREGRVVLDDVNVEIGESEFVLAAQADLSDPNLTYAATLTADSRLQDFVDFLDLIDIDDLQRGLQSPLYQGEDILTTDAAGRPNAPLLEQLAYIRQFVANLDREQAERGTATLPPLTALEGDLDVAFRVQGSLATGPTAEFRVDGQDWVWGSYDAPNQLTLVGDYANETLTLEPFEFEYDTAQIALQGTLGSVQQDATLRIRDVSLELLREFVALPLDLAGDLQADATIGGVLTNPTVTGEVEVVDPVLNGTSLQAAAVEFGYQDARLAVDGAAVIEDPERITIAGSIPYALPFMTVQPASDRLDLDIDVRNEGLAFLNLVSQGQAMWESGEGDIDLKVTGTLRQPQFLGTAMFQDGVVSSPLLSDPVTGITGTTTFNLNSVTVETLTAQLRDGTIEIAGAVPIFEGGKIQQADSLPLTITLIDLPLDFERFLVADLNGEILIRRAVLAPEISGQVSAANGRIITRRLPTQRDDEGGNGSNPADSESPPEPTPNVDTSDLEDTVLADNPEFDANDAEAEFGISPDELPNFLNQVQFDDFKLVLANDLEIEGNPFFNISAVGDLVINGTATDLRPDGVIQLTDGWINLFATQFRLDRDAPNTATFTPAAGLNPELDVQMVATVREVERTPVPPSSPFATAEVADQSSVPTFGGLQTVEIYATVQGTARELAESLNTANTTSGETPAPVATGDVLTLSSDPGRSESQIISLIGGQAIANLEREGALASVATFVGSGFLSNVGSNIADALGLSTFSIFPTTGELGGESRFSIAIGIEAGFEITEDLSFSVLEILDGNLDPQFGLQYEINDNFRVRASSDLNDDTRAILEYRNRF